MQIHKVYDNGGKTFDRFTVLTEPYHFGKSCDCLCLSDNPTDPLGFSQWGDCYEGPHLGKEISFDDLPKNVQAHVLSRLQ